MTLFRPITSIDPAYAHAISKLLQVVLQACILGFSTTVPHVSDYFFSFYDS